MTMFVMIKLAQNHPSSPFLAVLFSALAMIAFCSRFPPFFSWLLMQEDFCSMAASIPALLNKDAVVRRQNNKKNKSCTSSTSTAVTSEQQQPKYWHDRWSARVQHPSKLPARITAMINNSVPARITAMINNRPYCINNRCIPRAVLTAVDAYTSHHRAVLTAVDAYFLHRWGFFYSGRRPQVVVLQD